MEVTISVGKVAPPSVEYSILTFAMEPALDQVIFCEVPTPQASPPLGAVTVRVPFTAKLALEENREVLAVPGPIWSEASSGTNQLLKLGAKVCTRAADVLETLAYDRPELIAQARALLPLDPHEERLLDFLKEPLHVDDLGKLTESDAATVSSRLAILELKGMVKPIGGQMWVKGS